MKNLFSAAITILICASVHATSETVPSPVDNLFIPSGFDNTESIEVMIAGNFPNDCYSRGKVETSIQGQLIQIQITAVVRESETLCKEYTSTFLESVTLGHLSPGLYRVLVNGSLAENLVVKEASSLQTSEHHYPLTETIELGFTGGAGGEVVIIGSAPDCLEFVNLEMISNGKDSLTIFPKMRKTNAVCSEGIRNQHQIPVKFDPSEFSHHQILLFARSHDGRTVHVLVDK